MGVDVTSIVQLREEESKKSVETFEFWDDLSTIFRRGLSQKRLVNTTRWQLTIFNEDTEGVQLFDEVATLSYDLLDQFKAYSDFNQVVQLVPIPSSDPQARVALQSRYNQQLEKIPLVAQSVNVITHALREAVAQVTENIEPTVTVTNKDYLSGKKQLFFNPTLKNYFLTQ